MDFARGPQPPWPKADMFVTKSGDLVIKVELSEIRSEDIEITAEVATLRIKGSRQDGDAATAAEVIRRDIPRGPYELLLEIPSGFNLSMAKAAFLNGTLRISVPANGSLPQAPRFSPGK